LSALTHSRTHALAAPRFLLPNPTFRPRGTIPPGLLGPGAEFDLIRRFLAPAQAGRQDVRVGPGDDGAVVAGEGIVLSSDLSVEEVHFRRDWLGPEGIGYRAAAAALSDLAAMAARPIGVLGSLAVPARDLDEDLRRAATRATSLYEFEATVTAPRFGYPSYEVFTELERSSDALPRIRVPTLLLMGGDDPLVPATSLDGVDWDECPSVAPMLVLGAGHCGFYDLGRENLSVRVIGAFFEGAADGVGTTGAAALAVADTDASSSPVADPALA